MRLLVSRGNQGSTPKFANEQAEALWSTEEQSAILERSFNNRESIERDHWEFVLAEQRLRDGGYKVSRVCMCSHDSLCIYKYLIFIHPHIYTTPTPARI